jgi:hypothetical protein
MGNSGRFGRSRDRAAIRVEASSFSLASRQVQQARRSSRVVNASGSAKSATLSPPIVISRIDIALRPAVVSQDFSTGWYSLTDAPGPARKAQSAEAERVRLTKAASATAGRSTNSKAGLRERAGRVLRLLAKFCDRS